MSKRKPLTDEERQAFIDSLPDDEVNENAEQTFKGAIERASRQKQSAPEKSTAADDDCSDTQTHSDKAEDTSR
jgi:hypothetical protein